MDILTFTPPDLLQPYIKHTSFIDTGGAGNSEKTFIPVVDGCPGIIIQDIDYGTLFRQGKKLPPAFLFGQSTHYSELKSYGEFKAMCVYLKPHALGSLFSLDAEILTDSCLDFTCLLKGNELAGKLGDAATKQDKVGLLNNYLMKSLDRKTHHHDAGIHYAVEKIISSKGICSFKQLREEVHLSERSFERKFKNQVGISAKLFSRICKFQSSFKQLSTKNYKNLTEIALENDYADQSHFIKAFKEFSGFSPLQYQKKSAITAENLSEVLF